LRFYLSVDGAIRAVRSNGFQFSFEILHLWSSFKTNNRRSFQFSFEILLRRKKGTKVKKLLLTFNSPLRFYCWEAFEEMRKAENFQFSFEILLSYITRLVSSPATFNSPLRFYGWAWRLICNCGLLIFQFSFEILRIIASTGVTCL